GGEGVGRDAGEIGVAYASEAGVERACGLGRRRRRAEEKQYERRKQEPKARSHEPKDTRAGSRVSGRRSLGLILALLGWVGWDAGGRASARVLAKAVGGAATVGSYRGSNARGRARTDVLGHAPFEAGEVGVAGAVPREIEHRCGRGIHRHAPRDQVGEHGKRYGQAVLAAGLLEMVEQIRPCPGADRGGAGDDVRVRRLGAEGAAGGAEISGEALERRHDALGARVLGGA